MHKKSKGQSFLQGAFIMMAASLVVKVIGAFFQIPLQNLIGGEKKARRSAGGVLGGVPHLYGHARGLDRRSAGGAVQNGGGGDRTGTGAQVRHRARGGRDLRAGGCAVLAGAVLRRRDVRCMDQERGLAPCGHGDRAERT